MKKFSKAAWRSSDFAKSINILTKSEQRNILFVIALQIIMGLLDLLGVAVIGVLGALAVSGVQSNQPGNRVSWILEKFYLSDFSFQEQAAILGILATLIFVTRTLFSVIFTRKILFFLSRRGAVISTNLISRLLAQPLLKIQERTFQETVYSMTRGVDSITLGVIGTTVILVTDLSMLMIMTAGLFLVDSLVALSSLLVFSGIGYLIYLIMHRRAEALGREATDLTIASSEKILEVLDSYRELIVRNRRNYYVQQVESMRLRSAHVLAELAFMPNVSKYVIEATVVLGALAISAVQFLTQDAAHAVATLVVFLAAGTRIAPAVLRVQQGALLIRSSLGVANPTLMLISDLANVEPIENSTDNSIFDHKNFAGTISVKGVSLIYPGNNFPTLKNVNIEIPEGISVALVGPSGAGKTSLVDVILGVIRPTSGEIELSGTTPQKCVHTWPGAIGYVPQNISIVNGSLRENVALGFPATSSTDELVSEALSVAHLEELIQTYPEGIDTYVGERGDKLSGGQRQRLGIARALFTKPKLLVLDEATSALDGESEAIVSSTISALKGKVTVLMIAHRLSTVKKADMVIYIDRGRVVSQGTFEEVRLQVPDFDKQASLMGL